MHFLVFTLSLGLIAQCTRAADDVIKSEECPFMCACHSGNIVTCVGTNVFPEDLPKQTVEFSLSNSSIPSVPRNAFLNLPHLEKLMFSYMTIDRLRACSLAELENLREIAFDNVIISTIESNAFSNLNNITKIRLENMGITDVMSYGFHGLTNVNTLSFNNVNISVIHPYSFRNFDSSDLMIRNSFVTRLMRGAVSIFYNASTLSIKDSVISEWQCGSLETFVHDGNISGVSVTQSVLGCSCSLAWLWTKYPEAPVITEDSNRCKISGERLSKLTIDVVCPDEKSRDDGCPKLLPSTPHSCSREFDSPHEPSEKIDYPKYFTRTPPNVAMSLRTSRVEAVLAWVIVLAMGSRWLP